MPPLRLVFLGSDPIALPLLEWLADGGSALAQVAALFTQPDRPAGRGQKVAPNAVKAWALARALPVYQPARLTEDVRLQLAALGADAALVMAYGHILRDDFIATPRLGTFNLHASLLPKYRGAAPIQTAIACGETVTGISLMRIVRQLDAGPVADGESVPIAPLDTAAEIENRLAAACIPLLARTLPLLGAGSLAFTPQDEAEATYCRRLQKEDGALDFTAPAAVLAARINGLFPWPGCSFAWDGQPVKPGRADTRQGDGPPGEILGTDSEGLLVGTGQGILRLRCLQRAGGRMLPATDFLRGFPMGSGARLASRPMPALVGPVPFKS